MKEQVIIINGSPRKNGNSARIVEYISKRLDVENITYKVYSLFDMNIDYCNNCGYCAKVKGCRIKDDMVELYDHFDKSISTILVSPVAFDGPISKVKTLIDRTNAIYHSKYTLNDSMIDRTKERVGFHIQVAGADLYNSQFVGGNTINGFFFKSINSKLMHNLGVYSTDTSDPLKNNSSETVIRTRVDDYINELKNIMVGE